MTNQIEDLQREVEQSRAKLDLTLDRLEEKLTVSGVVDDLLGTARRSQFAPLYDHALSTLRSNPGPGLAGGRGSGSLALPPSSALLLPRRPARRASRSTKICRQRRWSPAFIRPEPPRSNRAKTSRVVVAQPTSVFERTGVFDGRTEK